MKKFCFKILICLSSLLFVLLSFSCQSDYYKWKYDSDDDVWIQKTTGNLKYKYQMYNGGLDIVVKYYYNSDPVYASIKMKTKDRYFRKKDIHLYLENFHREDNRERVRDKVEEINRMADEFNIIKNPNDIHTYWNIDDYNKDINTKTRRFSKDEHDSSMLILDDVVANDLYQTSTIGDNGGCDIELVDGDYTYTFRIYGKGAI